jgi:spoIIIJ-associated protein
MRSVEIEGGSIDEAIQRALDMLRVAREQVEIEILENATRGLFGIGSRRARVRATVRQSLDATVGAATDGRASRVSRETSPGSRRLASAATREDAVLRARQVLESILDHLVDGPKAIEEVAGASEGTPADGTIHLSLSASDSGMIIGRRGQTLDAMEHLVSRIVFRDDGEHGLRIALDVEGYRKRREESLRQLAHRLAGKAKETGTVVTLNPMSPRDRRIVHLALQADPDVTTVSQGEGSFRRLLITPQGKRRSRARESWR